MDWLQEQEIFVATVLFYFFITVQIASVAKQMLLKWAGNLGNLDSQEIQVNIKIRKYDFSVPRAIKTYRNQFLNLW